MVHLFSLRAGSWNKHVWWRSKLLRSVVTSSQVSESESEDEARISNFGKGWTWLKKDRVGRQEKRNGFMWHLELFKYVQRVISNLLPKSISFCALSLVDCQANLMFFSFLYDLFLKCIDVFLNDLMIQVSSDMNIAHTYVACIFYDPWTSWELCLWLLLHYLFFILFCMIVQWSLFVQWFFLISKHHHATWTTLMHTQQVLM